MTPMVALGFTHGSMAPSAEELDLQLGMPARRLKYNGLHIPAPCRKFFNSGFLSQARTGKDL